MLKLQKLGYELLTHTPYSTDLAPSEYFRFLNMKQWLVGKKFALMIKLSLKRTLILMTWSNRILEGDTKHREMLV